jgi:hypothetical protein
MNATIEDIIETTEQIAINALMAILGHSAVFRRTIDEINRVNARMPNATGLEKHARVLADWDIIFDDVIEPLAGQTINYLIESALVWLSVANPALGGIASLVAPTVEAAITEATKNDI